MIEYIYLHLMASHGTSKSLLQVFGHEHKFDGYSHSFVMALLQL